MLLLIVGFGVIGALTGGSNEPDGSAPATADGGSAAGPTAQEVIDAFERAGLAVSNPRDNSSGCGELGCKERITTDAITVLSFDDAAAAAKYVEAAGTEAYRSGGIVLSYAAARTPAEDRPKYEDALKKM
ncbi:hypothetical protein J2S43_007865 [Catenuloplanes nepalensis]|uniref:Uncharacterized protein n=1 Tax=Catenuloplanes nepalensis TaxID=587533 RepID=A0ABT9N740_9ACTN|nr:hypothetical protein [Catenuloplanes nepalensis]MDP9799353.1 hypothetical protein [Catenuloplanes nepalensis]